MARRRRQREGTIDDGGAVTAVHRHQTLLACFLGEFPAAGLALGDTLESFGWAARESDDDDDAGPAERDAKVAKVPVNGSSATLDEHDSAA